MNTVHRQFVENLLKKPNPDAKKVAEEPIPVPLPAETVETLEGTGGSAKTRITDEEH